MNADAAQVSVNNKALPAPLLWITLGLGRLSLGIGEGIRRHPSEARGFARCRCCCTGRAQHLIRRRQARNAPNRSAVLRSAARLSNEDAGEQGRRAWSGGLREASFLQCSAAGGIGEEKDGRDEIRCR